MTGQVPTSHAGHAFAELQKSVFHYEVMRLCTFWDSVDLDSRSIPTIAALADCRGVSKCVRVDHFSGWIEAVGPSRAKNYATRAGRQLRMGIRAAKAAEGSDLLRQTRNFRDKLAHQLEHNRAETAAVIPPPLYGDERILLRKTRTIVNNLYLSLNGTGFAWDAAIEMNRRDAEALWKGVTINVLR